MSIICLDYRTICQHNLNCTKKMNKCSLINDYWACYVPTSCSCCASYICINVLKRRWTNWWKRCSIIRCAIRNNNIFWITIRCLLRCCFISLQSKELMQLHKMPVLQLATNKCLVLCNSIQNWKVLW